jgi:uncharacterized protein YkwD
MTFPRLGELPTPFLKHPDRPAVPEMVITRRLHDDWTTTRRQKRGMMRVMRRNKIAAVALAAALLTGGATVSGAVAPAVAGAAEESFAPAAMWFDLPAEEQFLAQNNWFRTVSGLAPVVRLPALDDYARAHALWMAQTGQLVHSNIGVLLGPFWTVTENISAGWTIESMEAALVTSPPHWANMTNAAHPYTGIGVVWCDGQLWTVHVYAG